MMSLGNTGSGRWDLVRGCGCLLLALLIFLRPSLCLADTPVEVRVDLKVIHEIGGVSTFERDKFITIHSTPFEPDWIGEEEKLNRLCNELDVYFGRDSGSISYELSLLREDLKHPGYVEFDDMKRRGDFQRNRYSKNESLRPFESRSDIVVCAQVVPFWPGSGKIVPQDGTLPWALAGPEATAQYMVYWLNMYTGGNGPPRPGYLELINEPIYELSVSHPEVTPQEVFQYHKDVAAGIRALNPDVQLGGYTAAFPDFEKDNFGRWNTRWKSFIDLMGDDIDFYSFHLYDFPGINHGQKQYRKGCNLEATFDMLEHYSFLKFGKVKPILVSEYGSQLHDWFDQPWSPYRDWLCLKAINSMLIQMAGKPDRILKAIPFITAKAEWGHDYGGSGQPYYWRLLRKANEPEDYSGEWVFTDLVKFYELWSGVSGTRRVIESNDPNVLAAAWAEDNRAFLVFNNLGTESRKITLGQNENVKNLTMRHLYLHEQKPRLDWVEKPNDTREFVIGPEATMILALTTEAVIPKSSILSEVNHYATIGQQAITANEALVFPFEIPAGENVRNATLRLGVGRDHGQALQPIIRINGSPLIVPITYRGPDQKDRERFFGILELNVPAKLLQSSNQVDIVFPDNGGHVSSAVLKVQRTLSGPQTTQ